MPTILLDSAPARCDKQRQRSTQESAPPYTGATISNSSTAGSPSSFITGAAFYVDGGFTAMRF